MSFRIYQNNSTLFPPVQPFNPLFSQTGNRESVSFSFPFSAVNNNTGSTSTKTWIVNLPNTPQTPENPHHVFSINFKGEFTESNITGSGSDGAITADINTCVSYSMFTNFIYDSTWSPSVLPPFGVTGSNLVITPTTNNNPGAGVGDKTAAPPPATTVFLAWFDAPSKTLRVKSVLSNNYYIAGIFNFQFGDIYPESFQEFSGYTPTVTRITG